MIRQLSAGLILVTMGLYLQTATAQGSSSNLGYNSEYIFRGVPQKSNSVFGGLDYEKNGFYLGTWAADVGDGLEIDYYAGYGFEVGDLNFGLGGTWYSYTGGFDDDYKEINLNVSWRWFYVDMASGQWNNFNAPALDYQFYSLSVKHNGFYGTVGFFKDDFSGTYYEGGYGNSLTIEDSALFDYGVSLIYSDATLLGGKSDTNLVLRLSKSFSF